MASILSEALDVLGGRRWMVKARRAALYRRRARRALPYWDASAPGKVDKALVDAAAIVTAVTLLTMTAIDRPLALYLKGEVEGAPFAIWEAMAWVGDAKAYVIGALLCLAGAWCVHLLSRQEATAKTALAVCRYAVLALAGLAASGATINLMKIMMGRLRPKFLNWEHPRYGFEPFNFDLNNNTFPSGHAQTMGAVTVVLCLAFPRYRAIFVTIGATVSLSRVMINAHFLSDILAGAFIGAAMTLYLAPRLRLRGDTRPEPAAIDRRDGS